MGSGSARQWSTRTPLQMFMNLLLVLGPLLWLVWSVQGLETFFESVSDESLAAADGSAFQTDLVIAVLAAFTLQLAYAFLVGRYELVPALQRVLGIAAVVAVLAGVGYVGFVVLGEQRGSGDILGAFTRDVENVEDARDRLTSIDPNSRATYWRGAWGGGEEHPPTGAGGGTLSYTLLGERPG